VTPADHPQRGDIVEAVTVRRWVDAPPDEVWRRVVDLDGLVVRDPELDLVDLTGDEVLRRGTSAVLSRRRGARHVTLTLEVVAADRPHRLVLCVTVHRTRWTVRIELTPCADAATDLLEHAELDPATAGRLGLRSFVGAAETSAGKDVEALLDSIARRAAGAAIRRS
jgi:hypothetical protein